ncbi:MAG: TIGR01906 family membrane protein [Ardenticatenaceae bacterium]|nr:TIGR01906 family membrane protein [Ardenticatenaceae bacterium]MCB9004646.1 TIGR01906 family membrane protein [Ardenticatenaceae bacterium]
MENKTIITIIRWLVILAMPFFLGLGGIRAIIAWDYPAWEYQRIPSDQFGFSDTERLELARATLDYLQRPSPANEVIYLLEDLRLPGTNDPLYNSGEISHMIDVKNVADVFTRVVWLTGVIVLAGLAFLLARPSTRPEGYRAIFGGGLATTAVLLVIGLFILIGWNTFFVQFHELLFPPGTWTFYYTDSLIRLFPEQFWFDVGVLVSGGVFVAGLVVTALGYFLRKMGA